MLARTGLPPLSYSLIAFRRGEYVRLTRAIAGLKALGFRWLTFIPTYSVRDEVPLRIGDGPGLDELAAAVSTAAGAGMNIKFEPHLDWECTVTGGLYEWRRRMYVEPGRRVRGAGARAALRTARRGGRIGRRVRFQPGF